MDTIDYLLKLETNADEILVIDQTMDHEPSAADSLKKLHDDANIRWIKLSLPSITHAMNVGLLESENDIVLFLDDDIIPSLELISDHLVTHRKVDCNIVAGRVLQPWDDNDGKSAEADTFSFASLEGQYIEEFIGCNFSLNRKLALELGGFDENFVHVAYRYEKEFSDRALIAGEKIYFEPEASIRHLRASGGGTRSFGEHLKTIKPSHTVGAYYYLLQSKRVRHRILEILKKPLRAVKTRHHLFRPWWIFPTLIAEMLGFFWALFLFYRGPRYIGWDGERKQP